MGMLHFHCNKITWVHSPRLFKQLKMLTNKCLHLLNFTLNIDRKLPAYLQDAIFSNVITTNIAKSNRLNKQEFAKHV